MKSMLIIDTPDNCYKCPLRYDSYGIDDICSGKDDIIPDCNSRPNWCPLSPLPLKKDLTHYIQRGDTQSMTLQYIHDQGYNDCLDEILKED